MKQQFTAISSLWGLLLLGFSSTAVYANTVQGYRAFPAEVAHPSRATFITPEQFAAMKMEKIQEAPSLWQGHRRTIIWYSDKDGYVVQIQLTGRPDIFVRSACTFTPKMGMDMFDGMLAQDIEEYVLLKELGRPTTRLDVFNNQPAIGIRDYLHARGMEVEESK